MLPKLSEMLCNSIKNHDNLEEPPKPLSMKEQLRIIRDKCPGVWERLIVSNSCPSNVWLHDNTENNGCKFDCIKCNNCWNDAIGDDEQ